MKPMHALITLLCAITLTGCDAATYAVKEQFGIHKRDTLKSRVESAMEAQEEAKAEFKSAFEQFASVVKVEQTELKSTYETLNDAYEDAESRANEVSDRIEAVEDVSEDLFAEWRSEIEEISSAKLRSASTRQLRESEARYKRLIAAMRNAESRMAPVLTAFKDHVLFLKHNLNAQAIASLKSELGSIETNVSTLIREMETSITRSQEFIKEWDLLGESA